MEHSLETHSDPSTRHSNWYTSSLALNCLQTAFLPVVQDEIRSVRDATVSEFGRKLCEEATAEDLDTSAGNTAKFKHKCNTEQTLACQTLLNIIKKHTSESVDFFNMLQGTDPQTWVETPFDFLRLFLKKWMRGNIKEFKDCDISALCDIVTRFKPLLQMFDNKQIAAVRRVRNKTAHCAQLELSQQDMEEHIEVILNFLNHVKSLKDTDDVTQAITCINQLKTGDVRLLHDVMVKLIMGWLSFVQKEYLHKQDKANKLLQCISTMEKELVRLTSVVETAESIHKGSEEVLLRTKFLDDHSKLEAKIRKLEDENRELRNQREEMRKNRESRPGKPKLKRVLVDSVDIEWEGVHTLCDGDAYQVHIKNIQARTLDSKCFSANRGKIEGLQPGTQYVFKVCLVKDNGEESEYSENSDEVTTKEELKQETDRPGKPNVKEMYTDSVDIVMNRVQQFHSGDNYRVRQTVP